jgi:hypothetical protein
VFDKFIHDWSLPDWPMSQSFCVFGCSHSTGVGINQQDSYAARLSTHYNLPVYNLATDNGNIDICRLNFYKLISAIHSGNVQLPKFVVFQWPNPIRKIIWTSKQSNATGRLENINNSSNTFRELVKINEVQFTFDWILTIRDINTTCQALGLPIVNIYLDQLDRDLDTVFDRAGIKVHWDQKLPGKTWFFDSAAQDKIHHSSWCHEQWTKRLIPLIDETTKR